jgi:adhesin HecA-like repeat protein
VRSNTPAAARCRSALTACRAAAGRILSQSSLELEGGDLPLGAGSTTQAERIAIDAQRLDNAGGNLSATGSDARLHVAQGVDNSGGTIAGNGALDVQAGELINRTGTLSGAGTLTARCRSSVRWTITKARSPATPTA